jgi:hypothetical protein
MSDTHILHSSFKPGDSCIWRAIVKAVEILGPGYICRVGKGHISVWYDKWIDNVYLCNVVPYVDISDTDLRLCDLFENEVWNFNKLYTQLHSFYQDCIRSITIDSDVDDKLIWSGSSNGIYSASHGYRWLDQHLNQQVETNTTWSWIWRLPITENLRHFCWLVMHGSLPTNSFRASHHLTSNTSCHRCGAAVESDLHTLRDCPKAMSIWMYVYPTYPNNFYM